MTATPQACSPVWAMHHSVIAMTWCLQSLESCSKQVATLEKEVAALKQAKTALSQVVTTCLLHLFTFVHVLLCSTHALCNAHLGFAVTQ